MIPNNLGVDRGLYFNEEYLLFWWDNENIYYNIEKPTEEYLGELERSDLNSPAPNYIWETSSPNQFRKKKASSYTHIRMEKKIGYATRGGCTTNPQQQHPFLPTCKEENLQYPRRHCRYIFPGL